MLNNISHSKAECLSTIANKRLEKKNQKKFAKITNSRREPYFSQVGYCVSCIVCTPLFQIQFLFFPLANFDLFLSDNCDSLISSDVALCKILQYPTEKSLNVQIQIHFNNRYAVENHKGTVSIGGRTITNLHFADDIDGLAGEEEELATLAECLNKASTAYGMEISAEKTKLMTNTTSGINT